MRTLRYITYINLASTRQAATTKRRFISDRESVLENRQAYIMIIRWIVSRGGGGSAVCLCQAGTPLLMSRSTGCSCYLLLIIMRFRNAWETEPEEELTPVSQVVACPAVWLQRFLPLIKSRNCRILITH